MTPLKTGHRGRGRSRIAYTMLKTSVGSELFGVSFLNGICLPGCKEAGSLRLE